MFPVVTFRRAGPQPLAVLHVELFNSKDKDYDIYETKIGEIGKPFNLSFIDLINLIKARNGGEIRK